MRVDAMPRGDHGDALLQVTDLHVAYGKAEVVHGVTFKVRAGEFAVVLGRNGAGKSTILHAISGLIPKKQGTVLLGGTDVTRSRPRDILRGGVIRCWRAIVYSPASRSKIIC